MTLWNWLVTGSDVQTLPKDWLRDKMPAHDDWTRSQQQPGMALIAADTKATAQRQFWERLADQKPRVVKNNISPWKVSSK